MDGLLLGKLVATGGFAAWLAVNVLNHLQDFSGTLAAVASFMKMSALDVEPIIPTPLKTRRIERPNVYLVALTLIIVTQTALAVWFAWATVLFVTGAASEGAAVASQAFAGFAFLWFAFLISGAWFAYFIKQGDLQRTHMLLLGLALAGLLIVRS